MPVQALSSAKRAAYKIQLDVKALQKQKYMLYFLQYTSRKCMIYFTNS